MTPNGGWKEKIGNYALTFIIKVSRSFALKTKTISMVRKTWSQVTWPILPCHHWSILRSWYNLTFPLGSELIKMDMSFYDTIFLWIDNQNCWQPIMSVRKWIISCCCILVDFVVGSLNLSLNNMAKQGAWVLWTCCHGKTGCVSTMSTLPYIGVHYCMFPTSLCEKLLYNLLWNTSSRIVFTFGKTHPYNKMVVSRIPWEDSHRKQRQWLWSVWQFSTSRLRPGTPYTRPAYCYPVITPLLLVVIAACKCICHHLLGEFESDRMVWCWRSFLW